MDKRANGANDESAQAGFWSRLEAGLQQRAALGLNRQCTVSTPVSATRILRNGVIAANFGANDYLGLAWHPMLRQAASVAPHSAALHSAAPFGSSASPLVTGQTPGHAFLIDAIATFKETQSAIVFSSGYAANLGTVAALASKDDVIFSDRYNHASLIDGCRLSRAQVIVYPHCDVTALKALVQQHRHRGRFAFVATDSVFSMDGDLAPLLEIESLCCQFDMQCIVDEAHATGVYGEQGRGLCEHLSLSSSRIVSVGTLSKALGCVGGFVAGPIVLTDWLTNHARSWIYSTASTLPNATAARKAIELSKGMCDARRSLRTNAIKLRTRLSGLGFEVGQGDSPIIPIYIDDPIEVMKLSEQLLLAGVYVPAIRPPTVPQNRSLLRVSLSAQHSDAELDQLVNALRSRA